MWSNKRWAKGQTKCWFWQKYTRPFERTCEKISILWLCSAIKNIEYPENTSWIPRKNKFFTINNPCEILRNGKILHINKLKLKKKSIFFFTNANRIVNSSGICFWIKFWLGTNFGVYYKIILPIQRQNNCNGK